MCNTKRRMKIMNKKFYIAPESRSLLMEEELMNPVSEFGDPTEPAKTLTPTDEPYDDEFTARGSYGLWDEE